MRNARANMIENQIRAGGVYLQNVFDSLDAIRREDFVPPAYHEYAYAEMEIPLPYGQNMLTPQTEALVLQAVSVRKNDTVLEIGTGSGYMAALLAHGARHVTTIEMEPGLKEMAENNLSRYGVENVRVLCENGFCIEQYAPDRLFDVIVFSGAVSSIPEIFTNRLADNGRMAVFYANNSFVQALLLQKNSAVDQNIKILFETSVKPLREQLHHSHFCF
ncbi:protein-L-isoaspartate O-methyltransferase [Oxalobacter aliiformigenes]|uniref:Protein-L-isoaspartate O-methyltransferase n=1 Tax=Oxalobacter aliiformigenes TaxID=2946593 RepID=A0ABY7JJL4_9BURK|nr:protein-L-isoaspartate O-methyltransferase [Oxalobacter aliiformigenes]WAV93272.1 protein-L-isoaspartate O-methyltransferase [Oxalobacter aliiformigenes]WAV95226.1 protein-L-isoaspartate O-methyltransferase [Oxalobacter aliiformigenes]WAV96973.1 protein-L-isoaspartate O-methyltransferase [Oxalobacter aliiformigenes]